MGKDIRVGCTKYTFKSVILRELYFYDQIKENRIDVVPSIHEAEEKCK